MPPRPQGIENVEIKILFTAHLKAAAETATQKIEIDSEATLKDVFSLLCDSSSETLKTALSDEQGNLRPSIIICVDDQQTSIADRAPLREGSEITFLAAISGG